MASRAVLHLSDSCLIEVTECPRFPTCNPTEDDGEVAMVVSKSAGRKMAWSGLAKGASMRVFPCWTRTTGAQLLPKCKGQGS